MNCSLPKNETPSEILVKQLRLEVEELIKSTEATLLKQQGRIAELCVYIKENLTESLRELFNGMKLSGELTDVITDVVLYDIVDSIEKTNVYFDGVTTEKIFDETSSTYYYVTKVPKIDNNGLPIKFKLGIANDNPEVNTLESTLDFAHRKNATLCVNAGVYDVDTNLPIGTLIKDGKILYNNMPTEDKYQFLGIKSDGTIKKYSRGTTAGAMLLDGCIDVVCIFGNLIENGVKVDQTDVRKDVRQSLGISTDGTIYIVSCDGRSYESAGMSYDDLSRIHYNLGSFNAFILDGGGSTSTVLRGVKQNENIDFSTVDRKVNSFLYIARNTNVSSDNNSSNDLGIVKQEILERLTKNVDFINGYIRLRGRENYYSTGIEFFVNAENSRRSKLGISFDPNNARNTYLYWGLKAENTEKTNIFRVYDSGVWVQTYHGPSSERPNGVTGLCYFDEGFGKPIWYDGSKWVDATGTAI